MAQSTSRAVGREALSIGELSRRTSVPVKTLRFYSDQGLLPPAGRTGSNYRVYGEACVLRVELIRTLREAGLGLERTRAVLSRELTPDFDHAAYKRASDAMVAAARQAMAKGNTPASPDARAIVDAFVQGAAAAMGKRPDEAFRKSLRARFEEQDPRASRYWELVAILKGRPPAQGPGENWPMEEWRWFIAASRAHYP
jgi:DNA-binding transcriptional MerR regulator